MERPGGLPYFRKTTGSGEPVGLGVAHPVEQRRVVVEQGAVTPEIEATFNSRRIAVVTRPALGARGEGRRRVRGAVVGSDHVGAAVDPLDVDAHVVGLDSIVVGQHERHGLLVVPPSLGVGVQGVAHIHVGVDVADRIVPQGHIEPVLDDQQLIRRLAEPVDVGAHSVLDAAARQTVLQGSVGVDVNAVVTSLERLELGAHGLTPMYCSRMPGWQQSLHQARRPVSDPIG